MLQESFGPITGTVIRTPSAVGDTWHIHADDGTDIEIQQFSHIVYYPHERALGDKESGH